MKKILLPFSILLISLNVYSQSCCSKAANCDGMVAFAADQDFKDAHLAPAPMDYKEEKGNMITFETGSNKKGNAFYVPASKKTNKVLFVFHEWWGLNDYIKREAEKFQKDLDVNVYALDLYDGKVASTPDSAGKLMQGMNPERAAEIIRGLLKTIDAKSEIATIGWCMGGSWSFQSALIGGEQVKGTVMYYGFPETDINKIKKLKTDVLYIHALQDKFIQGDAVEKFRKDVISTNQNIKVLKYDADHAFANPSNPKFDTKASTDAYGHVLTFLKKSLAVK